MRFLHTSDWQLGMTRHFLDDDTQSQFTQARLDAIRTLARTAEERACEFVVVAGDVFETNQVSRRTVSRALEALDQFQVPVYLLPGNHDCLDPGSVYLSRAFTDHCPDHIHVLSDFEPRVPTAGVEIVGAPWTTKRPLVDLASAACATPRSTDGLRVVVAHGVVDAVAGDPGANPAVIRLSDLQEAVRSGTVQFVALGDRHSMTEVGDTERIWYSGTMEPTAYTEVDPGHALVVDLTEDGVTVDSVDVGTWRFLRLREEISSDEDIVRLRQRLREVTDPARTIVKLEATGALTLHQVAELDELLDQQSDVFGALERPAHHQDIAIRPENDDFSALHLTGYVATARDRLQQHALDGGAESAESSDALALLLRLARERP